MTVEINPAKLQSARGLRLCLNQLRAEASANGFRFCAVHLQAAILELDDMLSELDDQGIAATHAKG